MELELTEQTRSELLVLAASPDRIHPALPRLFTGLAKRRLAIRILHGPSRPGLTSPFAPAKQAGAHVHVVASLPYQLMVRDRSVVYIPLSDRTAPDRMQRVINPVLAASIAGVFDLIHWVMSDQGRGGAPGGQEQHEVLRALNDGLTDDRAAARLHLSKRTFARRVSSMMEHLNASSRFQAGAEAARRGWI
ncbi:helix-turn-helix transcriptional regulator [Acrocarpospora catenulata]|uniref:helix-turn-helix transcriptional regulator n=1 Tax=Acrocarpospora catenulata TaxID=2836182 RepID=UPI001BDA7AA9|nr:LuxR C-terminal-related transcriptional regulator [Acrocarpospora catenulata]